MSGHEHDQQFGIDGAQLMEEAHAGLRTQPDVEQDEVGRLFAHEAQALGAVSP